MSPERAFSQNDSCDHAMQLSQPRFGLPATHGKLASNQSDAGTKRVTTQAKPHNVRFSNGQRSLSGYASKLPDTVRSSQAEAQSIVEISRESTTVTLSVAMSNEDPINPLYHVPAASFQNAHKRSRLPSNDVARKVPRKSGTDSPAQDIQTPPVKHRTETFRRRAMNHKSQARQGSVLQKKCNNKQAVTSSVPRQSTAELTQLQTTSRTVQSEVPSAKSKPIVQDDDEYVDIDDEDAARDDDSNLPRASIETPVIRLSDATPTPLSDQMVRGDYRSLKQRTIARYEYCFPPELEGLQAALGADNWIEYLVTLERKYKGEITEQEFAHKTKGTFSVLNNTIRRRMDRDVGAIVRETLQYKREMEQQGDGELVHSRVIDVVAMGNALEPEEVD